LHKLIAGSVAVAGLGLFAAPASSAGTTVRLKDNVFAPKSRTVARNSTVTFRWAGKNPHNIVVTKGPARFSTAARTKGSYKRRMTRSGSYALVCTLHAGMALRLRVR
jgi:plastocyanin